MFVGRLQDDRQYTEALNPLDPNQQSNNSRYHSYRTDVQWNNTVHLSDLIDVPSLSATDLTFGYEHIADNINVKVNQSFGGFPFAQSAKASMTDDAVYAGLQTTLLQRLTLTGQIRQDWVAATRRSPGGSARCSTCRRSRPASRPPTAPPSARRRCSTGSASTRSAMSAIPT